MVPPVSDIVYLVLLIIMTMVGNIGNTMVIGAVLSDRRLRSKEGNMFILNLALADICVTAFVDPFSIAGVFTGPGFWEKNSGLCHVIGSICLISCVCSLWTIAAISFNRYILLCRNAMYRKLFGRRRTLLIILALWLGALMLDLPNFFNWGDHNYDLKTMACSYDRTASYSYTAFFISMFVTIPLILVLFCNTNIYVMVVRSKMRVASHQQQIWAVDGFSTTADSAANSCHYETHVPIQGSLNSTDPQSGISGGTCMTGTTSPPSSANNTMPSHPDKQGHGHNADTKDPMPLSVHGSKHKLIQVHPTGSPIIQEDFKSSSACAKINNEGLRETNGSSRRKKPKPLNFSQEVKLAKTLFIVFTIFCVCWTPYALLCLIDRHDQWPKELYTYAIFLAHSSSTINSILYAATNKGFRNGYKKFLRKCGCRCWVEEH